MALPESHKSLGLSCIGYGYGLGGTAWGTLPLWFKTDLAGSEWRPWERLRERFMSHCSSVCVCYKMQSRMAQTGPQFEHLVNCLSPSQRRQLLPFISVSVSVSVAVSVSASNSNWNKSKAIDGHITSAERSGLVLGNYHKLAALPSLELARKLPTVNC